MTAAKNDSTGMGRKAQDLGDSVNKLRKSLKHWQTLEVDYEALEEEISAVGDNIPETTAVSGHLKRRVHIRTDVAEVEVIRWL